MALMLTRKCRVVVLPHAPDARTTNGHRLSFLAGIMTTPCIAQFNHRIVLAAPSNDVPMKLVNPELRRDPEGSLDNFESSPQWIVSNASAGA